MYRECDTAVEGWEGDRDVINGTRMIVEVTGECPECVAESHRKKMIEQIERWRAHV